MGRDVQKPNSVWSGIKHHKWKTFAHAFTCFSVLFTLVKAAVQFFPDLQIVGAKPFAAAILISCGWAAWKVRKSSNVTIKIAHSGARLEILFGDLFAVDGIRAIAVTEYFDTQIGRPVSGKTIHGAHLIRHFSGDQESINNQLGRELAHVEFEPHLEKVEGKTLCYPIGTTAQVRVVQDRYLWFAVAKADPATCKASSDVELLWRALHKLWMRARIECNGDPLNLPLVGSGLAGLNLPTRDLLNLLILSAITESKANEVTHTIRIVLWHDKFDDVDLREVKDYWEG